MQNKCPACFPNNLTPDTHTLTQRRGVGGKFEAPGPPSVRSRTQEPNKSTERKTRLSPPWRSLERLQLKKTVRLRTRGGVVELVDILLLLQVRFGRFGKVFFLSAKGGYGERCDDVRGGDLHQVGTCA
ncbi:hypothetical protein CCM_02024 [Cordyceps militaris CM01]|uniref:Uncharacterized protein n=1 Tax=Cordyceps militaris (strain CM01) TaxID=983644 RepID=G3JC90_CORMM|nr:uncharacterized protein CCM_02024 [Cordyceps militaris CM01]EGX93755.1 hypothetical protein CCM_02024 [Cordyceps militaris CM01]